MRRPAYRTVYDRFDNHLRPALEAVNCVASGGGGRVRDGSEQEEEEEEEEIRTMERKERE